MTETLNDQMKKNVEQYIDNFMCIPEDISHPHRFFYQSEDIEQTYGSITTSYKNELSFITVFSNPPDSYKDPVLCTIDLNEVVKLWDLHSLKLLTTTSWKRDRRCASAYCIYKNLILSDSVEWAITVWDPFQNKEVKRFGNLHSDRMLSITVIHPTIRSTTNHVGSPLIIAASHDWSISIWNYDTCICLHHIQIPLSKSLTSFCAIDIGYQVKPYDGIRIFFAEYDRIRMWKWCEKTSKENYTFESLASGGDEVNTMEAKVLNHGDQEFPILCSASKNKCFIWDINSFTVNEIKPMVTFAGHTALVYKMVIIDQSKDGIPPKVVSCDANATVILWNLFTGESLQKFQAPSSIEELTLYQSKYGNMICWGELGKVFVWNLHQYNRVQKVKFQRTGLIAKYAIFCPRPSDIEAGIDSSTKADNNSTNKVAFKSSLVCAFQTSNIVSVFDLKTGNLIAEYTKHKNPVKGLLVHIPSNPSRNPLVISWEGIDGNEILVWDLFTQDTIKAIVKLPFQITAYTLYDPSRYAPLHLTTSTSTPTQESLYLIMKFDQQNIRICDILDNNRHDWIILQDSSNCSFAFEVFYPNKLIDEDAEPLLLCGKNFGKVDIWSLDSHKKIAELEGYHRRSIEFIQLYDPVRHLGYEVTRLPEKFRDRLAITCCVKNKIAIWNLSKRTAVAELHHHEADQHRIAQFHLIVANSKEKDPSLVVLRDYHQVLVYNLFTLTCLQVYDLLSNSSQLEFYNTGIANTIGVCAVSFDSYLLTQDIFYQEIHFPTASTVTRSFAVDLIKDDHTWPTINKLIKTWGSAIITENPQLFYIAVHFQRVDFLQHFLHLLPAVLPYIQDYEGKSLLRHAIDNKNERMIQILLQAWIICLNQKITTGKFIHGSMNFNAEDLIALAKVNPQDYKDFILSLRLMKNESYVVAGKDCKEIHLPFDCVLLDKDKLTNGYQIRQQKTTKVYACLDLVALWVKYKWLFIAERVDTTTILCPYFIPCKHFADADNLETIVQVSETTRSFQLFESELVQKMIACKWQYFAKHYFLLDFSIMILLAVNFLIHAIMYDWYVETHHEMMFRWGIVMIIVNILGSMWFLYLEVLQVWTSKRWLAYCTDFLNVIQLTTIVFILTTTFMQIQGLGQRDNYDIQKNASKVAAATMPLLACNILYYFSGFSYTGSLVRMIIKITQGTFKLTLILVVVLLSFAGSFVLLFQRERYRLDVEYDGYTTYPRALMTVYGFLYGTYRLSDLDQAKSPGLAILLLSGFLFFIVIILLNLLIAIMGDIYDEVQDHEVAELHYGKAKLILKYEAIVSAAAKVKNQPWWNPTWIAMLKADGKKANDPMWSGKVRAIKQLVTTYNQDTHTKIAQLKEQNETQLKETEGRIDAKIANLSQEMEIMQRKVDQQLLILQGLELQMKKITDVLAAHP